MSYNKLISGYKNFFKEYFKENYDLYKDLSVAQNPKSLVISCSDSRVDPSHITNSLPGDLFVIRNVANLVPSYKSDNGLHGVSSALEFAVNFLLVENIIVCGHSYCAGVKALADGIDTHTDFISNWVDIGKDAKNNFIKNLKVKHEHIEIFDAENNLFDSHLRDFEKKLVEMSIENLLTYPWIKNKYEEKKLSIYGWYFDIKSGKLFQKTIDKNGFDIVK